ncbi:hypothetical protein M6I34_09135 [Burkholderiaceae bacterium FT117]|uniref:hypothetical protein n=1 Tax=Zeimonas sediminis TaxID=2944268 RepID=UPI002342C437|nr:hypothetical protein [Zeimonas sediminis]MCM5570671.1 hypothetical protein [Zeimonas sediminis]
MAEGPKTRRHDRERRLQAACLACRLLALAAAALAIGALVADARPADAGPALTIATLAAIVALLAGRQR